MSIAQRLCHEIVEPVLKSSPIHTTPNITKKYMNYDSISHQKHGSATRSIVIQKKKDVNKFLPRDTTGIRPLIKAKETILKKKLVDVAVNTFITGPLKTDNDCVTNVRKRDNRCGCKCSHRKLASCKASAKQIQTHSNRSYLLADKACAHTVETVSCGTQFFDKLCGVHIPRDYSKEMLNKETMALLITRGPPKPKLEPCYNFNKPMCHMNDLYAKRWALSQYPVRGPDF